MGDNLLTRLIREPNKEGVPLNLLFVNKEGPVGDLMDGGHLGHTKIIDFSALGEVRRGLSRAATWDFWRVDICLSGTLANTVP